MSLLADVVFALFAGGVGRVGYRRRSALPEPSVTRVVATPWITAGMAAITAQGAVLVAAMIGAAQVTWRAADDDVTAALLFMIGVPVLLGAVGVTLSVVGWMVGVFRKLVDLDSRARVDLAAAGIGGLLLGVWIAMLFHPLFAVVVGISSVAALVISIAPGAWHESPASYPLALVGDLEDRSASDR